MAYQDFVGRTEIRHDTIWPPLIRGLAATLDVPEHEAAPGGVLPPLWHWMLFQDWHPAHALGPDGHPRRGGFLPPVDDLPRRMWAGSRIALHRDLHAGERVRCTSTIEKIEEKSGGSGRLVFVAVRHEIASEDHPDGPAIVDEQDIVYRSAQAAAVKPAEPAPFPSEGAWTRTIRPDPVILFRYSALTGNGHRIHYDLDYVRREEGYPGLVVHGPLQATLLADLLRRNRPGAMLTRITFRARRPAFHQHPLTLVGVADGHKIWLETRDHEGAVCMVGEADLA